MDKRNLFQVSTLTRFQNREYDGLVSIKEMLEYGDTGFGTFHELNGEMIVLNSIPYRALGDCSIAVADQSETTPFAVLGFFSAKNKLLMEINGDIQSLMNDLTDLVSNTDKPAISRLTGVFPEIVLHGVWPEKKPYEDLDEIVRKQVVYTFKNIPGSLVGIFCPQSAIGMNVVGWHFHFISDDLKVGGHVNDLIAESLLVEFSVMEELQMIKSQ